MPYIFIDKEGDGGKSAMRSQMRDEMRRRQRGGYYREDGGMSPYEEGYREGYKHGYEDCDNEKGEDYRHGRGSGRYL